MVSVPTARQRPRPLLAGLAAAVAGVALALTGSAPVGAEPPGAPAAVPSLTPDRHPLPPWLDPASEPVAGVPSSRAASRPGTPVGAEPPAPATPTPAPATPAPATPAPAAPAPSTSAPTTRPAAPAVPDRTEGRARPAPPAAHVPQEEAAGPDRAVTDPTNGQAGQGADWTAQPIKEDTRGLDQRAPAAVPSPSPDAPAQPATRLAAAGHERPDWYARSLVYSGLLGLTIALYGMSIVLRRRRTW
jgi:hypothetical protein